MRSDGKMETNFLILEWSDGWREVIRVSSIKGFLRYYVIQRMENVGRLVLDKVEGYPELLIIERKPRDLSKIVLYGMNKAYRVNLRRKERFGDKVELSGHEEVEDSGEIKKEFVNALRKRGYDPNALLSLKDDELKERLKELGNEINLYPSVDPRDAFDFMKLLLEELVKSKS
jgi:hypothetical protein